MKIVNIDEENLHIIQTTQVIPVKFSENVSYLYTVTFSLEFKILKLYF